MENVHTYIYGVLYNAYIRCTTYFIYTPVTAIMEMKYWRNINFYTFRNDALNVIWYFQTSQDGRTNFLKVHAPQPVLERYADIINMQKPIKARSMFCLIVLKNLYLEIYLHILWWRADRGEFELMKISRLIVRIVLSGSGEIQLGWVFEGLLEC